MAAVTLEAFLSREAEVEKSPLTTITGSGGKTALMFAIAGLLSQKGRVVVTAAAKIAVSEAEAGPLFIGSADEAVKKAAALPRRGALVAVCEKRGEKLCGYTPQEIDMIAESSAADWLVAEADGSRRLPLKGYEEWEPPVPSRTTLQFIVIGADAFIRPFGEETAFRHELLQKRFGLQIGEILSPQAAARILSSRSEYLKNSPPNARRVLFLNKFDLLSERKQAEITRGLSEAAGYDLLAAASLKNGIVYETVKLLRNEAGA